MALDLGHVGHAAHAEAEVLAVEGARYTETVARTDVRLKYQGFGEIKFHVNSESSNSKLVLRATLTVSFILNEI